MMRTVWSARPTAKNLERCSPGGTVPKLMQTISAAISFLSVYSFNCPLYMDKKINKIIRHYFLMLYLVHLKIHDFTSREGDDNLPLIQGTSSNNLLAWCSPLIHTFICTDVSNPLRINLQREPQLVQSPHNRVT